MNTDRQVLTWLGKQLLITMRQSITNRDKDEFEATVDDVLEEEELIQFRASCRWLISAGAGGRPIFIPEALPLCSAAAFSNSTQHLYAILHKLIRDYLGPQHGAWVIELAGSQEPLKCTKTTFEISFFPDFNLEFHVFLVLAWRISSTATVDTLARVPEVLATRIAHGLRFH